MNPNPTISRMWASITRGLEEVQFDAIESAVEALIRSIEGGHRIWVAGNGGSCANASHFAADLTCRGLALTKHQIFAGSLSSNPSIVTAITNDHGWEHLYVRQINALVGKGDCLVVMSVLAGSNQERVSIQSSNLLAGLQRAHERGCNTVGILGSRGGTFARWCDVGVLLSSSEPWVVEPIQAAICHLLVEGVISSLG